MFAKSSGTTNDRSKYIPISQESLKNCHFKGGIDMLSLYCDNFPDTNIFNGKGLMLGGSKQSNTNVQFTDGDLSALLINNFPFWVNMHRLPDLETALMKNWDKKLDLICHQSLNANVTNITGVPSWMLILLNRIIEKSGANNILEIWPNLELFMRGGVNFGPYINQFKKLIPSEKMNSGLQEAFQDKNLHWAQKAAVYTFSLGIFFIGLSRTFPSFNNLLMGIFRCNG